MWGVCRQTRPHRQTRRLHRSSLPQLVADELLGDLERGVIRRGQTLPPESELATQYGISRAVVREALKTLQAQGLVEVVNGVGSVVLPMSATPLAQYFSFAARLRDVSVLELIEVRRGLEGEAASLAATRATPRDLAELEGLVVSMGESLSDPSAFSDFDTAFHVSIARATNNQVLVHLVEAIRVPLRRSVEAGFANWMRTGDVAKVHEIHANVLDAIRRRDPAGAAQAMIEHFEQAMRMVAPAPPTEPAEAASVAAAAGRGKLR